MDNLGVLILCNGASKPRILNNKKMLDKKSILSLIGTLNFLIFYFIFEAFHKLGYRFHFSILTIQSAYWTLLDHFQVHFRTNQITNIVKSIFDHCWTFQGEAPGNDIDIFRDTHGQQHFWSENPRISNLDPFIQSRMETENLHTWFGVGIVGWLKFQFSDA